MTDNGQKELMLMLYLLKERRVDKLKIGEKEYPETYELVEELKKREGVEAHMAEPYKDLTVTVNGPAVVLVVTD